MVWGMLPAGKRIGLEQISGAAIVMTAVATLALALFTWHYVKLTRQTLEQISTQTALSSPLFLALEPEFMVRGEPGQFTLQLVNKGLSEATDIQFYEDYYVLVAPKRGERSYIRAGALIILPEKKWGQLDPGKQILVDLDFSTTLQQMNKLSAQAKGFRMGIARFTIRYRRRLDGADFTIRKAYIVAGDGSLLVDSERELEALEFTGGPPWGIVKRELGVD